MQLFTRQARAATQEAHAMPHVSNGCLIPDGTSELSNFPGIQENMISYGKWLEVAGHPSVGSLMVIVHGIG